MRSATLDRGPAPWWCAAALIVPVQDAVPDELPTLRARSRTVDVIDNGLLRRGYWFADPQVPLDVYMARRADVRRTIEFHSDLESKVFELEPGETLDFAIALEDGGRCVTRISTQRRGGRSASGATTCTVPFRRSRDGKIHVEARIGDSGPLDLMFDTGADTLVLYPSGLAKVPDLRFDGSIENQGFAGRAERRTSSDNRFELGDLVWEHETVMAVPEEVEDADGILGWVLFEERVVAIDLEAATFTVQDASPAQLDGCERLTLEYHGSLPYVNVELRFGESDLSALCVLDSGSSAALHLSRAFADEHGLRSALSPLGTSRSGGIGGARTGNDVARLPFLGLGAIELADVPVHLARQGGAPGASAGTLGMDVLGRFDLWLDARDDALYLRPNAAIGEPFREDYLPRFVLPALATLAALIVVLTGLAVIRLRRRHHRRVA
jgi:hypothetical protein